MLKVLDKMYIGMKNRMRNFLTNEDGAVDIVAIVVLCGIVVAVAIIFRDQISGLIKSLFKTINGDAKTKIQGEAHPENFGG
jgi:Flp pilus assembly pilin Flp